MGCFYCDEHHVLVKSSLGQVGLIFECGEKKCLAFYYFTSLLHSHNILLTITCYTILRNHKDG